MSNTKIYEDAKGNASSARAIGIFLIINAVLILWACVVFGFKHPDLFSSTIQAGSIVFTAMTTGVFFYLYNNKKTELKST